MTSDITRSSDTDIIDISDIMMLLMVIMMASLMSTFTTQAAQTAQALQAQSYVGLTYDRTLTASPVLQWVNLVSSPPYNSLITAHFHNDGPSSVLMGVNNPDELTELAKGEDESVDMTGGARRIEFIFYKTYPGIKASVRVLGKY